MAKRSRKNISKVIAIIASLALALGLMPVTASAAGEGPDGAGGQAPDAPQTVAAAGPEAPPASPGKAGDGAAEGGKAVDGGAQNGAETSDEKPGETGAGKAGAPVGGSGGGVPEAAPAGAGGAEGKGGPAGQAGNPGQAGDPETAATAAGNGAAAANVQAAAEPVGAKALFPAFRQSRTVGGVTVTVEAGAGAFPEGARLSVASVPSSRTEAAVAPERDANENVAASYTFDIKVLGADGAELQPAGGKSVRVSFAAVEVADPNLDVSVYHVSGGSAEELAVSESGTTATATSGGFSYYTVEFTYGELQYVLQGGGSVPLADVLATVGLEGEPTAAASSDPDLFAVARDASGAWTVSARRAFTSTETLTVTVNGTEYVIAVTDDPGNTCGANLTWELTGEGNDLTLTISGTGKMTDYENPTKLPWYSHRLDIRAIAIGQGVTSIGSHAFHGCSSLKSVTIPSGVTTIGNSAFMSCSSLAGVTIPNSVTSIGNLAFNGCENLESVTIPNSVTSIGDYAFYGCAYLVSVEIPGSVKTIGRYAFYGCTQLSSMTFGGSKAQWDHKVERGQDWNGCAGVNGPTIYVKWGVAAIANPKAGGTVNEEAVFVASFDRGVDSPTCTLEAAPGEGYHFANWTDENDKVIKDEEGREVGATYTFTVEEDCTLTANFEPAAPEITGQPEDLSWTYGDEAERKLSVAASVADGGTLTYQWYRNADGSTTGGTSVTEATASPDCTVPSGTQTGAGSCYYYCVVTNTKNGATAFATSRAAKITVEKRKLTIAARDQAYVYNGKQQGEGDPAYEDPAVIKTKVAVEGQLAKGDEITSLEMTGMQTSVGAYGGEIKITGCEIGKNTGNYAITFKNGKLTIAPAPLTVTADSASKRYDGTPLTADGFTCEGLAEGDSVASAKVEGSQTDVGSSANTVSGAKVVNAKGEDVTGCYEIAYVPGTLTVEAAPARKGTLTFDLAGGTLDGKTGTVTVEANVGDTIKLPGAPTREGYAFKYWKGSEYAAGAEYKVEGDHAFAAEWAAVHTVAFNANGHGKAPDAQTVEHGKKAKKPANPTADGYTFGGWYKDKACKEAYDFSKPVTEDITLYAKWTKKSSSGSGTSPKTGDPLAGAFAIALVLAAASALALALSRRRSRG